MLKHEQQVKNLLHFLYTKSAILEIGYIFYILTFLEFCQMFLTTILAGIDQKRNLTLMCIKNLFRSFNASKLGLTFLEPQFKGVLHVNLHAQMKSFCLINLTNNKLFLGELGLINRLRQI